MSEGTEVSDAATPDDLLQLRFTNDDDSLRSVDVEELAASLLGLRALTDEMFKAGYFGDGSPPSVRAGTPREGSFILEVAVVIKEWAGPAGGSLAVATAVAQGIRYLRKRLRGVQVTDYDPLPDGRVKVTLSDNTFETITEQEWQALEAMPKKSKKAMEMVMRPLVDEDVTRLEIRSGSSNSPTPLKDEAPQDVLTQEDHQVASQPDPKPDVDAPAKAPFEVTARMQIVDFRPDKKWGIEWDDGGKWRSRKVTLADGDFLIEIAAGRTVSKSDLLRLLILEVPVAHGQQIRKDWTVTKVISQRRGGGDDDGDAAAT